MRAHIFLPNGGSKRVCLLLHFNRLDTQLCIFVFVCTFLCTGAIHFDTGANQNIKLLRLPAALLGGCVAVLVIRSRIRFWVTTYIDFADHFSMNLQ